jgi:hypothetical protein
MECTYVQVLSRFIYALATVHISCLYRFPTLGTTATAVVIANESHGLRVEIQVCANARWSAPTSKSFPAPPTHSQQYMYHVHTALEHWQGQKHPACTSTSSTDMRAGIHVCELMHDGVHLRSRPSRSTYALVTVRVSCPYRFGTLRMTGAPETH